MLSRWGEAQPWPDTRRVLIALGSTQRFIVTNCSQKLGERAAKQAGEFVFVMTAEQAGAYKPDPRPYRAALAAIGMEAKRVLFVAGSAHDVGGAKRVGMDVYWANRHLAAPPDDTAPLVHASVRGANALVTRDDGNTVLPTTDTDWDGWVSADAIRNWPGTTRSSTGSTAMAASAALLATTSARRTTSALTSAVPRQTRPPFRGQGPVRPQEAHPQPTEPAAPSTPPGEETPDQEQCRLDEGDRDPVHDRRPERYAG